MNLRFLMKGAWSSLYYIEAGRKFDVGAWLKKLERDNEKEFVKVFRRLEYLANHQAAVSPDKFRSLKDGLYELKTNTGSRILFFYDGEDVVICATGFSKPSKKVQNREIQKGLERKAEYFQAKSDEVVGWLSH